VTFKQYKAAVPTLGVLLITMTPLWAENEVLLWLEGKKTQSTNDPCAAKFPGTQSYLGNANTCWGCPKGSTLLETGETPACSTGIINPCHNQEPRGEPGKNNICIYCLSGKYNGKDACI